MTATGELDDLRRAYAEARQHVRSTALAVERLEQERRQLSDRTLDALADGDDVAVGKARKQRHVLEGQTLPNAREAHEASKLSEERAGERVGAFAVERIDDLLSERADQATAAARAVEAGLGELDRAHRHWEAVAADVSSLLRLAGRSTRDVPDFPAPVLNVARAARRASDVTVPPPLPATATGARAVARAG